MAKREFDIVVIGGGAGGLVVAAGGAALGAKIAIVEKHRLGGDCLWYGCVPSKTLIKSARVAHEMRHADRWALAPAAPAPDLAQVMARVADVIKAIEPNDSPERFRALGVDVVFGDGRFVAPDVFDVDGRRLSAKSFVIATGSRPAVPPIPGLDATPYLTNETVFALRESIPSLIVIGAGAVGCELAQAFRRLGSDVAVVDIAERILPHEDPDLAAVVFDSLAAEGVRFHLGAAIAKVEGRRGDVRLSVRAGDVQSVLGGTHLLVAAGRTANIEGLALEAANVRVDGRRIVVDSELRTTNHDIYVIGDAAGGAQYTHLAEHHAGIVLRRTLFRMRWAKPSPVVPRCTYTDPELAGVGVSEAEAKARGIAHRVYRFGFDNIDRARTEGETEGFAKIVTAPSGKLLGAFIVGAHAGELIAEYVLALANGMKAKDLTAVIHAYPTLAQINRRVADQRLKEGLTPSSRRWLQRLFGLQGATNERGGVEGAARSAHPARD
jgi:pyruvate/2-oxoglutarate dehydrogenase complex dihydrolipoamide dehydrogenase (E3) component